METFFDFFAGGDAISRFGRIYTGIVSTLIGRYVLLAGFAFLIFYRFGRARWSWRKIQRRFPRRSDYAREVGFSAVTFLIFGAAGYAVFSPQLLPHTNIYFDVAKFGWEYLVFSVGLMVVIHDAYFYWTHRLMHIGPIYRRVHAVHHRSISPSPWAAFAFHPLEAVVEGGILFVFAFTLPMHPLALLGFMFWMTVFNVLGHTGYEIFPRRFTSHPLGRWLNTPTAHDMHHERFRGNYGLYFRIWDVLCRTTHPKYEESIAGIQGRRPERVKAPPLRASRPDVPAAR